MVMFSTTGERKDSVNNIEATGEFVVNFCRDAPSSPDE